MMTGTLVGSSRPGVLAAGVVNLTLLGTVLTLLLFYPGSSHASTVAAFAGIWFVGYGWILSGVDRLLAGLAVATIGVVLLVAALAPKAGFALFYSCGEWTVWLFERVFFAAK